VLISLPSSSVLKEVIDLFKRRNFKSIFTDHLHDKIDYLLILTNFQHQPASILPQKLNVSFIILFVFDLLFLFASQQSESDKPKVKNYRFFVLIRQGVQLILLATLGIFIGLVFVGKGELLFDRLNSQKRLVVNNFKTVAVEVDPLRHDEDVRHQRLHLSYTFQQLRHESQHLLEVMLIDSSFDGHRVTVGLFEDKEKIAFMPEDLVELRECLHLRHGLHLPMTEHLVPT
jgi:hypothetical protein